jgi:hypothetical protein
VTKSPKVGPLLIFYISLYAHHSGTKSGNAYFVKTFPKESADQMTVIQYSRLDGIHWKDLLDYLHSFSLANSPQDAIAKPKISYLTCLAAGKRDKVTSQVLAVPGLQPAGKNLNHM